MELTSLIEQRLTDYARTQEGDKDLYELQAREETLTQNQIYGLLITMEEKMTLQSMLDATNKITEFLTMK